MKLALEPLNRPDREFLADSARAQFLHGGCYGFAIALHAAFGWKMLGLVKSRRIVHVALEEAGGTRYFDARGWFFEPREMNEPYRLEPPYDIREVTKSELQAVPYTVITERAVEDALHIAFILWPNLPWTPANIPISHHINFLQELEVLSKKYNLWLSAPTVTTRPRLDSGDGDESYRLYPSPIGRGYFIDRIFVPRKLTRT